MTTWVYRPNDPRANRFGMVDKEIAGPRHETHGAAPNVIGDIMPETRHMANGKTYTSKSEFRKATRAAGCYEVGNDFNNAPPVRQFIPPTSRAERREDIRKAYEACKSGNPNAIWKQ